MDLNRQILKDGNSFIITLVKSLSNEENRFTRINVKKIVSLKDIINKPINEITFKPQSLKELDEISNVLSKNGDTQIMIEMSDKNNDLKFQLKNKRNIDRKTINILRNKEIFSKIA